MKYLGTPQSALKLAQLLTRSRRAILPQPPHAGRADAHAQAGILRAAFGSVSAAWQKLTSAARAAWTGFVAGYPMVDALRRSRSDRAPVFLLESTPRC